MTTKTKDAKDPIPPVAVDDSVPETTTETESLEAEPKEPEFNVFLVTLKNGAQFHAFSGETFESLSRQLAEVLQLEASAYGNLVFSGIPGTGYGAHVVPDAREIAALGLADVMGLADQGESELEERVAALEDELDGDEDEPEEPEPKVVEQIQPQKAKKNKDKGGFRLT